MKENFKKTNQHIFADKNLVFKNAKPKNCIKALEKC